MKPSLGGFSTGFGAPVTVTQLAVEAAKGALETEKSSFGGFSTGSGAKVQVDKSAVLVRVRRSSCNSRF